MGIPRFRYKVGYREPDEGGVGQMVGDTVFIALLDGETGDEVDRWEVGRPSQTTALALIGEIDGLEQWGLDKPSS